MNVLTKMIAFDILYIGGTDRNVVYPDMLKLYGQVLPWVQRADHLGHVLSQMCNMENNA